MKFYLTETPLFFSSLGIHNIFHFLTLPSILFFNHFQILSPPSSHSLLSPSSLSSPCLFSLPPSPSFSAPSIYPSRSLPLGWCSVLFSWRQCVPHHSLCFLLSTVLLSVAATHAREKGWGGGSGEAADAISRWRFHYRIQGPSVARGGPDRKGLTCELAMRAPLSFKHLLFLVLILQPEHKSDMGVLVNHCVQKCFSFLDLFKLY